MDNRMIKDAELKNTYSLAPDVAFQWLEDRITKIKEFSEPVQYFYGRCNLENEFESRAFKENFEACMEFIREQWTGLLDSRLEFQSDRLDLIFYCDLRDHTAELRAKSFSMEECQSALTRLTQVLGLQPVGERAEARSPNKDYAVRHRYSTLLNFEQWFEKFTGYVSSSVAPLAWSGGWYRSGSYFYGSTIEVQSWKEWVDLLRQNWPKVDESSVGFGNNEHDYRINFDHRRSLIELEVKSSSVEAGGRELSRLENSLDLKRLTEDPYRYRKSAAVYKVGYSNKKSFVDGTRALLEKIFQGQIPATDEAYTTKMLDNNIERLDGFFDVDSFLEFIEKSDDGAFDWANLNLEGVNGRGIGISLNKKDKLLEIRSTLLPSELDEEVKKAYHSLDLRLTKGSSTGSDIKSKEAPQAENWWVKYSVQILVAILAAAAVLLQLARAYYTSYELNVTKPVSSPVEVDSAEIELGWYLWPADGLFHDEDYEAPATIVISYNGKEIDRFDHKLPPYTVPLTAGAGEYIMEVQPDKEARPATIVVIYKPQSSRRGGSQ